MTFEARTRTELVREALARLGARYEADGEQLDTRIGSPAWLRAQGIAAILEMLDLQAAGAEDQILPDRAAGLHLAAHGELAEVPQSGDGAEAWRARILAWWREGMPPMGAQDWIELLESHPEVDRAFVYPCVNPETDAVDTPGCTTIVVLGAPQGDSGTQNVPDLSAIVGWLAGTESADGVAEEGPERRPVCAHPDAVQVLTAGPSNLAITVTVENDPSNPFPWLGTMTTVSSTVDTLVVTGDHTDKLGLPILVNAPASFIEPARGGFKRLVPTAASYDGGTNRTTFTFAENTFQVPWTLGATVYPCPPNWQAIRLAVFELVDSLGPGDTASARRVPPVDVIYPATLYPAALRAAVLSAEGVVNATTTLSGPSTTSPRVIHEINPLTIQAAP